MSIDIFTRELRAVVARLSTGYTFNDPDPGALEAAQQADRDLDAVGPAQDLPGALVVLRRWEKTWTAAGSPRTNERIDS